MLWLKLLLACCVVLFSVALGYFAAEKFRNRARFYTQLHAFNERYLNELGYARKPLSSLLDGYAGNGDFQKTLRILAAEHKISLKYSYLTDEEKKECANYLSMLGRSDAHTQREYFGGQRNALSEKKSACAKVAKEKGELYLKLGLLAGLAFIILIV